MKKGYLLKIMSLAMCSMLLVQTAAVPVLAEEQEIFTDSSETETDTEFAEQEISEDVFTDNSVDSVETDFVDSVGDSGVLEGTCSEDGFVKWTLEDGILTISGTGAMECYGTWIDGSTGEVEKTVIQPWKDYRDQILEINVEDGVTELGMEAFNGCSNLTKVTLSDSVKIVGNSTFFGCSSLTDIQLGAGVELLSSNAFYGTAVTSLTLPASLQTVDVSSFFGMSKLQNIYVEEGSSVYQSKDGVLFTDNGLTLFVYPQGRQGAYGVPVGTTKIGEYAFYDSVITAVDIPDTVTEIGDSAFGKCGKLAELTFPKKLKVIGEFCCFYCRSLTTVTIPDGVTTIGRYAFDSCYALSYVRVPGSVTGIGEDAFSGCKLAETPTVSGNTKIYTDTETKTEENAGSGGDSENQGTEKNDSSSGDSEDQGKDTADTDGGSAGGSETDSSQTEDENADNVVVNVVGCEAYSKAFEVLDIVNRERAAAGLSALTMDQSLLETAMLRAAETALYWSHTRPTGQSCFTANSLMFGENIVGTVSDAETAMNIWMNSSGHKANILGSFTSIGVGCVEVDGITYWVQCFGYSVNAAANSSSYSDRDNTWAVSVKKDAEYYKAEFSLTKTELVVGESAEIQVKWGNLALKDSGVTAESSDPAVCVVEGSSIRAAAVGTAEINIWYPGYKEKAAAVTVTVTDQGTDDSSAGKDSGENSSAGSGGNTDSKDNAGSGDNTSSTDYANGGENAGSESNTGTGAGNTAGIASGNTTESGSGNTVDTGSENATGTNNESAAGINGGNNTVTVMKFTSIKLSRSSYVYNGKKRKPSVEVYTGSGKLGSTDYTVSYKNNKNVGIATVTIKGKRAYSQYSGTATFRILPKKEAITRCKSTKKQTISISWKKASQVQGYQYQICRNKNFKGSTTRTYTVQKSGRTSAVIKKLTSGKAYYVRVRSFRKVNGTYLYGSWSSVKKVTVR